MASRQSIEFPTSDGLKLRGWLYSAGAKRPCIILSHGLSGLKTQFLGDFASHFQSAGYTSLVYDNRHWGESDGHPRNHTDPILQTRDYSAAFDYAASLPTVDPERIVFWGSSLSGGNVISAAAVDRRVRAVISQVPFVSGELVAFDLGPNVMQVLAERAAVAAGAPPVMIPVNPASLEELNSGRSQAVLKQADVFPFLDELDRRGISHEREITLQSLFCMLSHEPRSFIRRLSPIPLLMVVGEHDRTIPTNLQLAMYQEAQEPKSLHIVRGQGHFGLYYGVAFKENVGAQLDFLKTVL